MTTEYSDRWIECGRPGIAVRGYYFPWGTKRIPYESIRSIERVPIGPGRGTGRISGTANPGYWASLDPGRPRKVEAVILDLGRSVKPFLTPDDVGAFVAVVRSHTDVRVLQDSSGPVI